MLFLRKKIEQKRVSTRRVGRILSGDKYFLLFREDLKAQPRAFDQVTNWGIGNATVVICCTQIQEH
jgi:hypothetical protein